jgi:hypothetical protein
MKKSVALFGVFLLATIIPNLAAKERHGADTVIVKKNAQVVRGELIAVKDHSILVLNSVTKSDISVEISDMVSLSVKFAKKSNPWGAGMIGFVVGGALGAFVGHELGKSDGSFIDFSPVFASWGGAIGGIVGFGGGYLSATKKRQEVYNFQGKSPEETLTILARLRTYARVPGYR